MTIIESLSKPEIQIIGINFGILIFYMWLSLDLKVKLWDLFKWIKKQYLN